MNGPQVPPPGSAAPPSPSGAAGTVALPGEIVRLPQELAARLLNGLRTVFVSGTVTGQGADGSLRIRSQFGEIAVRSGTTVPADRQVGLQIPPLSGKAATLTPTQLSRNPIPASLLLTKPPLPLSTGGAAPSAIGSPASARPAAFPVPATPVVPSTPTIVSAPLSGPVNTSSPSAAVPAQASAPTQQQGVQTVPPAQTSAVPIAPGSVTTAPSPVPLSPHTAGNPAAPATPPAAGPSPTPPPAATVAAPPLGRLALTNQMLTQSTATPAAAAPTATNARPAVPSPGAGGPIPGAAPPGAAPPAPTIPTPGAGTAPTAMPILSSPAAAADAGDDVIPLESMRRVPSLREAVSVLSAANPGLATQFVRSVVPQSNTQLAATLLFFLAATRSGDIRGWMGDRVTSTLDNTGRGDLLAKLSAELATPARALPDQPAAEWRSQTVPLVQHGDIGGMNIHVRRPGEEDGETVDGTAAGRRFLIDMDLSRMGPLQFDGLVHNKRFDLTIRSPAAFPESMRQDMRILFRNASDAVGLHGGLTFQAGGHDWATVATTRGG